MEMNYYEYKQAVDYVNSTLAKNNYFTEEQWELFYRRLFKDGHKGLLGCQMLKYTVNKDWNEFWDLFFEFFKLVISQPDVMNNQLNVYRAETNAPGEKFSQWLLNDCVKKVVVDYRNNRRYGKYSRFGGNGLHLDFDTGKITELDE